MKLLRDAKVRMYLFFTGYDEKRPKKRALGRALQMLII
jgi:hypothetical protein